MNNYYSNYSNNAGNNNFRPQQPSPIAGIKRFFFSKSMLSRLIIINIAVFLVVNIYFLFLSLMAVKNDDLNIINWLAVPSDLHTLLIRPWTLLTYMFFHVSFWHLAMNMLVLFFGGSLFKQYLGEKKLLSVYIFGGLSGALFYVVAFNVFPVFQDKLLTSVALGASASVMAIIIAAATYLPNYPVYLFFFAKVKMKYIAAIYIVVDMLSINEKSSLYDANPGGHIAHLGGALFGFLFILALKKGISFKRIFAPVKNLFRPRMKVKYSKEPFKKKPLTDDEYSYQKADHQKKIDTILDKISKSGYESLSKEEKELLFKSSKK